jgi:RNA polymerase sigma-70 factor, ECF subfamily
MNAGQPLLVMDEAAAVRAARGGSLDALGELYRQHADFLYRSVLRFCDSADEAQDVVQEVFVGLPESLARFDAARPLRPWLRAVAVRVALTHGRSGRRRMQREAASAAAETASSSTETRMHQRLTLDQALQRMPREYRDVFLLRELEGYSHADIAVLLGIAEGTSASRLHRAWKHLRKTLRARAG